jgi:hypothetical protein
VLAEFLGVKINFVRSEPNAAREVIRFHVQSFLDLPVVTCR